MVNIGNKCRHCPYDPKHLKGNKKIDSKQKFKN